MANLYNLKQLEDLSGGMDEFIDSMIETFLEHTPGQLNDMEAAFRAGNWEQMGSLAHKIKPSIDLFEVPEITNTIREIEKIGKSGSSTPDLAAKVDQVSKMLNEVFEQLRAR
jgi:HPt (histidine-containing phosphotransfer) domain-containing protein